MNPALLALILTQAQANWLNVAYNEGSKYGLPKYTQAIILVESSACLHRRGDDGRSFGCGQLQVATARKFCQCNIGARELSNNSIRNIRITAKFLDYCFRTFWPDKGRAIICYNEGAPRAAELTNREVLKSHYVARVLRAEKMLEQVRVNNE